MSGVEAWKDSFLSALVARNFVELKILNKSKSDIHFDLIFSYLESKNRPYNTIEIKKLISTSLKVVWTYLESLQ